jgi:EmrB/QacA subfamily drug resistance transporter
MQMALEQAEQNAGVWRGGLILFSVCVAAVSLTIDLTIIGVALDPIGRSLDASFAALQFLIGAYNVPFAALLLISGVLADRYGRLKLFIAGNVLFALFALFAGLSASMETLNTWRALQGLGAAMIMPACSALIAHGFHGRARAIAFGAFGASFGLGTAIGPLVGGMLIEWLDWRWVFFINVPIAVVILLATIGAEDSRDAGAPPVDWLGLGFFSLGLFGFISALILAPDWGWAAPATLGLMAISLLLIAGFLVVEARKTVPSFDLALFKTPTFTAAQVVLPVGVSFAFITLLFYLPFYLQGLGGMGPMQSGLALLPLTLPSFFVPFLAGWMAGFLSFRLIAAAGLAMLGVGTLLQSTLTPGAPDLTVFIGMALAGSGVGIVHAVNDNLAVSTAPQGKSGVAAGMLHTMRLSTETVAIIAAGAIMVTITLGQLQAALPGIGEDAARLVARADIVGRTRAGCRCPSLHCAGDRNLGSGAALGAHGPRRGGDPLRRARRAADPPARHSLPNRRGHPMTSVQTPEDMSPALAAAFNARDLDAMAALYEDEAVLIDETGAKHQGISVRSSTGAEASDVKADQR